MPLSIKRRVTLDLSRIGYQLTIPFMQSDKVAHEVYITVTDGTEIVSLPAGTRAAIAVFNGVEGGVVDDLIVDHANNVLQYTPTPNALAVAGNVKCTLTLFDEYGAVIGAPSIILQIMSSDTAAIGEELEIALEANPAWNLIVGAAANAERAKAAADDASESAEEAKTSETNANYSSNSASSSAATAKLYMTDAKTYRQIAESKANEAAESAAAAKASEESARADAASVVGSRAEIDAEINRVSDTADEALSIASGATQAITVRDYAALVELLNNTNKFEFNVGQNIYVETFDVTDVWIKGYANDPIEYTYTTDANLERELLGGYLQIGYTLLSPLEGAKVDLTDYAKKTYVNSEIGKSEDRSSTKIREANERIDANETAINSANEQIDAANRSISANTANITALEQNTAEQISTVAKHTASVESMASRNSKRLDNIEAGIPDDDFITDNSTAYVRDVPSNALPFAEVSEIGGATRKCTNLWSYGDISATEFPYIKYLTAPAGTYTISLVANSTDADADTCRILLKDTNGNTYFWGCERGVRASKTVTLTAPLSRIEFDASTNSATSVGDTATFTDIMLNKGETAIPYEPYFEGLRSAPVTEVVSEGANLWAFGDISATEFSYIKYLTAPAGTYTISLVANSTDADADTCRILLKDTNGNTYFWGCERGVRASKTVTLTAPLSRIEFDASTNSATSVGDTATFTDIMLNKGTTALPYRPYFKRTLTMPEVVRALPDYGAGIPNTNYFNRVRWRYDEPTDKRVSDYGKRAKKIVLDGVTYPVLQVAKYIDLYTLVFAVGNTVPNTKVLAVGYESEVNNYTAGTNIFINANNYLLVTLPDQTITTEAGANSYLQQHPIECIVSQKETVTDISHLLPEDNLIGVEGGGSMTPVNEHGDPVPMTIIYQKEVI